MKAKKIFNWIKEHLIISALILILLVWGIEKLWPIVLGELFVHPPAAHVETLVLKPQAGVEHWQALGTVKAAQDIVLSSEVTGTIQNLTVNNSAMVKEGQVLLNVRHEDMLANLQKNQAILTQKELYYQRLKRLLKTKSASEEAMSVALSEFQQAQAMVNADKAMLDKYIIRAPFAGQIGIWQVDIGELVRPGDPLVTLTDWQPSYIDFMLPAKVLSSIHVGDAAQFTTASFNNRIWNGKVTAIDPQLDPATRSVRLRALVGNRDGKLVPRLYGQITVIKPLPPQLLIPQEAIIYDPKGSSVYVLQKNMTKLQPIKLGPRQGNDVVVEHGLKAGDEVVTVGMMELFPGMAVVVNKQVVQK